MRNEEEKEIDEKTKLKLKEMGSKFYHIEEDDLLTRVLINLREAEMKIGDIVTFGPYEWRVLDIADGKALLITKNIIEIETLDDLYNPSYKNYHINIFQRTWNRVWCNEESVAIHSSDYLNGKHLYDYLNGKFLDNFSEVENDLISETCFDTVHEHIFKPYYLSKREETQQRHSVPCRAKVFLLDENEARKYFKDNEDRAAAINYSPKLHTLLDIRNNEILMIKHTDQRHWLHERIPDADFEWLDEKINRLKSTGSIPWIWQLRNSWTCDEEGYQLDHGSGSYDKKTGLVSETGEIYLGRTYFRCGLRPALWVENVITGGLIKK